MKNKLLMIIVSLIALTVVLSACGESTSQTESGEDVQVENEENDQQEDNDSAERITETGIYNGQADSHTIEIETAEGPQAFQLTDEARDLVEDLVEGEEVTYTYYEDGEQLIIENIVQESSSGTIGDGRITETGIYIGQADPHTIEIETAEGPQAFQLTMEARDLVEHLTEDEEVTFTYYQDGEQLIIEKIE